MSVKRWQGTPIRPPATFPHPMGEGRINGVSTRGGGCYRALAPGWYGIAPFGAYGGFTINWSHVTALRAQQNIVRKDRDIILLPV